MGFSFTEFWITSVNMVLRYFGGISEACASKFSSSCVACISCVDMAFDRSWQRPEKSHEASELEMSRWICAEGLSLFKNWWRHKCPTVYLLAGSMCKQFRVKSSAARQSGSISFLHDSFSYFIQPSRKMLLSIEGIGHTCPIFPKFGNSLNLLLGCGERPKINSCAIQPRL